MRTLRNDVRRNQEYDEALRQHLGLCVYTNIIPFDFMQQVKVMHRRLEYINIFYKKFKKKLRKAESIRW